MNMKELNQYRLPEPDSKIYENDGSKNNEDLYSIPDESSCSPEFSQGCIFIDP